MTFRHPSPKGFTLIEIMVVVTIIALLIVFLVPQYGLVQARTRLSRSTDQLTQMLEQARTLAMSGYKQTPDSPLQNVGVYLEKESNQLILFTKPFAPDEPLQFAPSGVTVFDPQSTILSKIPTVEVSVRALTTDAGEEPQAVAILFSPPFGNSRILNNDRTQTALIHDVTITLGVGTHPQLQKKIQFFATTNRIQYDR